MTPTRFVFGLWLLLFRAVCGAFAGDAEADSREPAAVVCARSGRVSVSQPPEMKKRSLQLFDWLPAGAIIEVGQDGASTVAFATGRRYELGVGAKVTLAEDGFSAQSGSVQTLSSVPPLPRVAAIAQDAPSASRAGAVRIRGLRIADLYPRADSTTLPDATVLRFAPTAEATTYKVDIEDEGGKTVFSIETQAPSIAISAGVLKPAARYDWRVRTLNKPGPAARGEGEFTTLSSHAVTEREALRQPLHAAGDAASLALLAEIDRRLGLLYEAREDLRAALVKSPGNEAIREALKRLEAAFDQTSEPR